MFSWNITRIWPNSGALATILIEVITAKLFGRKSKRAFNDYIYFCNKSLEANSAAYIFFHLLSLRQTPNNFAKLSATNPNKYCQPSK